MYKARLTHPAHLKARAEKLGARLAEVNARSPLKKHPRYDRGDKQAGVYMLGVWGELIARRHLRLNGVRFKSAPLIQEFPYCGPDITIGETTYDVKTSWRESADLLVNRESHEKGKDVGWYWFIKIIDDTTSDHFIYSHKDVSNWDTKKPGYAEAYYLPVEEAYRGPLTRAS